MEIDAAKTELSKAWKKVKETEKYGLDFGEKYLEWSKKLSPPDLAHICSALEIDLNIAGWWAARYLDVSGFKKPKKEARINRSEPPDSFEPIRKLAIQMLNKGFDLLWSTGQGDRSQLSSAKAWAYGKLKEQEDHSNE